MSVHHTSRGWAFSVAKARYWRALEREGILALPCHRCGAMVDVTEENTGRYPHSRSVDHVIDVARGGGLLDLSNFAVSHPPATDSDDRGSNEWCHHHATGERHRFFGVATPAPRGAQISLPEAEHAGNPHKSRGIAG